MKKTGLVTLFIGVLCIAIGVGCYFAFKPKPAYVHNEGEAQGTTWSATYEQPEGKDLQKKIEKRLHEFDLSLNLSFHGLIIMIPQSGQMKILRRCTVWQWKFQNELTEHLI